MFPPQAPPPGGPPPMPGPGPAMPGAGAPPPQAPSPVDQVLLKRFQMLTPQEHDALDAVTPDAAAVIMKLVPELKPVIQMMMDEQGGSEGEETDEPDQGADDGTPEQDEPDGGGMPFPQKPKTALGRI